MEDYNPIELGHLLAKRRKELGKRQADLADEHISKAYISNIENGRYPPTKEKLAYLCRKLELNFNELDNLLKMQEKDVPVISDEKLKLDLFAIEDDIDSECLEEGYTELKSIEKILPTSHYLMITVHYLKGKYLTEKGKWKQAISQYSQSIQKLQTNESMKQSNIESACYCGLARISNFLNNVPQALYYIKKGLEAFVPQSERDYIQYHLLISQAIYLITINQTEEAQRVLDKMWDQIGLIKCSLVILNMYETQAILLNKTQKYHEAISVGMKGLELARLDRVYERKFELWTTVGTSYIKLNKLEEAKRCFQSANKLTKKVKNEYLFIRTKTQLGLLHLRENYFESATATLKEAVILGKKTKDNYRLCEATIALGDCYLKQKDYANAKQYYELGLKLTRELCLIQQEPDILLRLLKCTEKIDRKLYDFYTSQFIEISVKSSIGGENIMILDAQIEKPQINRDADPPPP